MDQLARTSGAHDSSRRAGPVQLFRLAPSHRCDPIRTVKELVRQVEPTMVFPTLLAPARSGSGPRRPRCARVPALFALLPLWLQADDGHAAAAQDASTPPPPFRFEPGAKVPALLIPRAEELVYRAYLDYLLGETHVGKVVQTCTVEQQKQPLVATRPVAMGETACIKLEAEAEYFMMELSSTLEARILPQDWPRLVYRSESTSSQTRKRELWLGRVEEQARSRFQSDTRTGAPKGTRIWKPFKEREVPEGSLDMISAVFMTRALMREGQESLTFPLVDKDRVWQLTLKRGEERKMKVPAGVFEVVEVVLEPAPYPDEKIDPDKLEQFEGVFGIQGTIHLWVEKKTGIAVRIQGSIPVKFGTSADVDVELETYSGTPKEFGPLPVEGAGKKN